MCGISGIWEREASVDIRKCVTSQIDCLRHRGPDGKGIWYDDENGVALGHARLSILELTDLGSQPMHSRCGRYVISYNGEVYNFQKLRSDLSTLGHVFKGTSDTEVMLAAISEWGVFEAVKKFVGMFAFALWDRKENTIQLCRDRIGIKPIYYYWDGKSLVFASELKALKVIPHLNLDINRDAVTLLLRHSYIPSPFSIYRNVSKLLPGQILTVGEIDFENGELPDPEPFWSAKDVVESRGGGEFTGSATEAVAELDRFLGDAIEARMISDVPLGAFLSGGVDSSTVVAIMQSRSSRPVRTFSIGFSESEFNEAVQAKEVADYLGTNHTEWYVSPKEAQAVIPNLPHFYDEPFSDSSQIPTMLVSELAKRQVTVSLSGDGGDELFAGYNRYEIGHQMWMRFRRMPGFARSFMSSGLRALSEKQWNTLFRLGSPFLPQRWRLRMPGYRAHKFSEVVAVSDPKAMYRQLVSHWNEPEKLVVGSKEPLTCLTDPEDQLSEGIADFRERMMYLDLIAYLQGDVLTKVDRASMSVGLEARVPLLDHRVVEFAWSLPMEYKIRNGRGKWVLRKVLEQYLPERLINRPKMGFGIPIGEWLRGDLRDWAESLLDDNEMMDQGILDPSPIRKIWGQHLSGDADWQYLLWDVLMFQAWIKHQE
ncbi:MAG: asparagine synthase (glutamine-hydrolyzing) [Verrucomicrobiota bacterium]